MYKEKKIGVVIPAYNEGKLIGKVIETIPDYVDRIIIVDDCSKDNTSVVCKNYQYSSGKRIILIYNKKNKGVGGSIAKGYKWCRDNDIDISVVMAGDGQMDPNDMPALLEPIVNDEVDYSKGNRLISGEAWKKIPKERYFGNAALSLMTKIASGYWHVADSQTGYTAANRKVLETIDLKNIYKRYGMPNDMLVKLNIYNFRVRDVKIKPIYGQGEKSGIKPIRMIPKLAWLITKLFFSRMWQKYIIRDFHPLVIFYLTGIMLVSGGICFGSFVVFHRIFIGSITDNSPLFVAFLFITGWQFILFGMWFDMEYNKELR